MSENLIRRKSKVSDGRSVRVGLVGPKSRLRSVDDGHQVNIPEPATCCAKKLVRRSATEWIVVLLLLGVCLRTRSDWKTSREKLSVPSVVARTANRHR